MQSPAAAAACSLPHHVVRLSTALAALLGRPEDAEGAEAPELSEDELLVVLREAGLITYPSPLLGPLLELPAVFAAEVLPLIDPKGRALVARVGQASRVVVVASGLPRAGTSVGVPLKIKDFITSVELLAWARENGCPWIARTCAFIAQNGHLQVLHLHPRRAARMLQFLVSHVLRSSVCVCRAANGGDDDSASFIPLLLACADFQFCQTGSGVVIIGPALAAIDPERP